MSLLYVVLAMMLSVAAPAQDKQVAADPLTGKYEGVAKSAALGEIQLKVEIKNDNGKLSGKMETPQGTILITEGRYAEGRITMKFDAGGNEGTVTGQLKDDKVVGEWTLAGQTGTFELKKIPPATTTETKPASNDLVSGEWEATADVQGTSFPFNLKLKLEGDKVTGEANSVQGTATISKGSLDGDKLTLVLNTQNGTVTLTGTISGGKIAGQFDFAGQFQGKWEAKKK
jgi:hypothetical protein